MNDTVVADTLHQAYTEPVARLLTLGEADYGGPPKWLDYPSLLGLAPEHIPALIRMACDEALHYGDGEGTEIWAPIHAWRALGQLRAVEAVEPLLAAMHAIRESEAPYEELSDVFAMIGPDAIPPIAAFLSRPIPEWAVSATACDALTKIVTADPGRRDEVVAILVRALESPSDRDPTTNGYTIASLLDLAAVEAIDTIREAYRLDAVDWSVAGDLEDVEIDLGLRQKRVTPKPFYPLVSRAPAEAMEPREVDFGTSRLEYAEPRTVHKIGRNEPCPCGSGKKYKKCCMA